MRRFTIALVTAVSSIALTQIASAADLPRKAPPIMPAPVPVADWSGVYVGLEGGYGWGHQNVDAVIPGDKFNFPDAYEYEFGPTVGEKLFFPDVAVPSGKQKGWLFGGFAGAQKQWGGWVFGIEADFDAADLKGSGINSATNVFDVYIYPGTTCGGCLSLTQTVAAASKIDELGSVRGKVGFVLAPDWLIYGTGGLAYAHVKNAFTATESYDVTKISMQMDPIFSSVASAAGTSMFGWAAGAGVDWKFWHDAGSAWVLGVEYLHYGFGDQTVTFQTTSPSTLGKFLGTGGNTFAVTTTERVDTIKGRISYLFSIH
jgi:outer membrane immunogenic protein